MPKMVEVEIDSVRVSLTNQQRIVILKEKSHERYLPIWIGLYEAEAITIALQEIQVARPQTHDLLNTLIKSFDADLLRVEVVSLSDDVFYGTLVLSNNGEIHRIDCRPSDALALAARTHVSIMISEDVMHQAGIVPETDITDEDSIVSDETVGNEPDKEDLDVFEDFLQNFNLDDLGDNPDAEEDDH